LQNRGKEGPVLLGHTCEIISKPDYVGINPGDDSIEDVPADIATAKIRQLDRAKQRAG